MRLADRSRPEIRPEGDDEQHRQVLHPLHCQAQEFEARRVAPVRILEHHQHRAVPGQAFQLADQIGTAQVSRPCRETNTDLKPEKWVADAAGLQATAPMPEQSQAPLRHH